MTEYLTPPELAKRLRVRLDKVHTWIRSGELRAVNVAANLIGRPRWRISAEALAEFEQRRAAQPPVKKSRRRKRRMDMIEFF